MFSISDTIVAIATPPGRGGIGVVRVSGADAHAIAQRLITHAASLAPRYATLTKVRREADMTAGARGASGVVSGFGRPPAIDHAIVTYFPAPASYTGDDVVEISAHGSPVILRAIVASAIEAGARLAEPGEFTLRAFVNGRIDLPQAEAVADLIDAVTPLQARAAFDQLHGTLTEAIAKIDTVLFDLIARLEASIDFPDEGYHFIDRASLASSLDAVVTRTSALLSGARKGRLVRDGLHIAIVGGPNVGKSSLFNALVGTARAIVTEVPGTTRDLVSETIDLDGLRVTLVDTAGIRATEDIVEGEGVARSKRAAESADLTLLVVDQSRPYEEQDPSKFASANIGRHLIVANKTDLPAAWRRDDVAQVSATIGTGVDGLRRRMGAALDVDPLADPPAITNVRHIACVERAHAGLVRARDAARAAGASLSEEFVLADLQDARTAFEEVTGRRTPADVLEHIFARFCIGK